MRRIAIFRAVQYSFIVEVKFVWIDKEKLCDVKDDCGNNEDERGCIINSELCWG